MSGDEAHVIIAGDFNSDMTHLKDILNDGLSDVFPESDGKLKGGVTWAEPN
jgi:hypothetical protein